MTYTLNLIAGSTGKSKPGQPLHKSGPPCKIVTFMSRAEGVPGKSCPPEGLKKINDAQGSEWNEAQRKWNIGPRASLIFERPKGGHDEPGTPEARLMNDNLIGQKAGLFL